MQRVLLTSLSTSALKRSSSTVVAVGTSLSSLPSLPLRGGALRVSRRAFHTSAPRRTPADVPSDLAKDIEGIIRNDRLVMFLTGTPEEPRCRFTMQTVDLMDQLGVRYGYFNILDDEEVCEGLKRYSDWPTYPQVYLDGELIGGYDICKQMMLDGSLVRLLKEKDLL